MEVVGGTSVDIVESDSRNAFPENGKEHLQYYFLLS